MGNVSLADASLSPAVIKHLVRATTPFERVTMACPHEKLRSFTFSDGKQIKLCPDCSAFDAARSAVLRYKPDGQENIAALALELAPEWLAQLQERERVQLKSLASEHHGHDPHLVSYSGLAEDFADVVAKQKGTPEAHHYAVSGLQMRRTKEENNERMRQERLKQSQAKELIRIQCRGKA